MNIPNTSSTRCPELHAPENACDAHIHIYDPSIPTQDATPENADATAYRKVQNLLGTRRAVVVQPRVYGTDNTATVRAIEALGRANTRGIAVISTAIDDTTLHGLHESGIRGIRFSFYVPNARAGNFESIKLLAHKIAPLGWHVQLHWTAEQIAQQQGLLENLPTAIVFDHMARLPHDPQSHPAFAVVARLLESGRAWVKLSGAYLNSDPGTAGDYIDTDPIAKALISIAPERLVWGTDWPHVTEHFNKPDDAKLFDVLGRWCGDEAIRRLVLVDNPQKLYGFSEQ